MYEEDADGGYLHVATEVLGDRVFFEVVQRLGDYDGYGTADVPVRMAAQRRARVARVGPAEVPPHDGWTAPPAATGNGDAAVGTG
jgi:4-hydroxyphenylpyruvate dioxygenase-like putative hemolysin